MLWIAARLAASVSLPLASLLDAAFAATVAWGIGRPILASRNRNWFFILLVLALGAASSAFLAWPRLALSAGLDLVLFIIAVMAGRVVPGFTNNAVPGAGARRIRWVELGALGSVLFLLALDLLQVDVAALALLAAVLHAIRVSLWAPFKTWGRPILWILGRSVCRAAPSGPAAAPGSTSPLPRTSSRKPGSALRQPRMTNCVGWCAYAHPASAAIHTVRPNTQRVFDTTSCVELTETDFLSNSLERTDR